MRLRSLARSNDPAVEAVAMNELSRGGTAIDAVLAGYFAAAGANPGVLLGPVTLLLGGVGSGDRAFDGRVRQPGIGAKRPRGTLPGEEPPAQARVGIPCSVPALAVALGYGALSTLARLVQPGVAAARERGAERRAALLQRVGEVGALALAEPELSRALVRVFGAPNGGLVTPTDFARPTALDLPATRLARGDSELLVAPWAGQARAGFERGASVCAVDVNGLFVAAAFECHGQGLFVDELELSAPLLAEPTWRGVPRLSPGAPLRSPAPLWIQCDGAGAAHEIWAAPNATPPGAGAAERVGTRRNSNDRTVEAID